MKRLLPVLLLALAGPALAQSAEPATRPWSVEPVLNWRTGSRFEGLEYGARSRRRLAPRLALRLGLTRFEDSNPLPRPSTRVDRPSNRIEELGLEVGLELDLLPGRPIDVGPVGSVVIVHGRASDAEEWEAIRTTDVAWRAGVTSRIPIGRFVYLRPELAVSEHERVSIEQTVDPPTGFLRTESSESDLETEISFSVGFTLGR